MKLNKILSQYADWTPQFLPTGLMTLDRLVGGLPVGHLTVVGARPAMGKSAFALTLLRNIGIVAQVPFGFLSLGLSTAEVLHRILAAEYGQQRQPVDMPSQPRQFNHARELLAGIGFAEPHQPHQPHQLTAHQLKAAPVWVEHGMEHSVDETIAITERLKRENDIRVMAIDGFSWLVAGQTLAEQERAALGLAQMARRLGIAVVLTANLTREVEHRVGHLPMLHDLRGGSNIEAFSDLVLLLYRPEYYGITEDEYGSSTRHQADVIVAKNTFGPCGTERLHFEGGKFFKDNETFFPEIRF